MYMPAILPAIGFIGLTKTVCPGSGAQPTNPTAAKLAFEGLDGYGIPFDVSVIPAGGGTLPALTSSPTEGNYGGIVTVSELSVQATDGSFASTLTAAQWQQLYDYQTTFGVRMVRIDAFPSQINFGVTAVGAGCCAADQHQELILTDVTGFPTANINGMANVSMDGLFHYPATIVNASVAQEIAQFLPVEGGAEPNPFPNTTTAAVLNRFPNGGGTREQMVFFMTWAPSFQPTSLYLNHAWIHWMTRGLYAGFRRVYFNTQIDDVHLETTIFNTDRDYRISPADLIEHVAWMEDINSRLPDGSNYIMELGHNGNGNLENATEASFDVLCPSVDTIEYNDQIDTPLEFQKPLGTGTDIWPPVPTAFNSTLDCMLLDPLLNWLHTDDNKNNFMHVSHTFTHEALNNATYADTNREIEFNQAWLNATGLSQADKFAFHGLIPPAITGLHNGDAIRAWLDNGISNVVGDNSRPALINPASPYFPQYSYQPLTSTVAANGFAGLNIVPRFPTTIFFNCDTLECDTQEWVATSGGSGDFSNLLQDAKRSNSRILLGLHHDPFMFHQANLRTDVAPHAVEGVTRSFSLLMAWVETVMAEMSRLTTWPVITKSHNDIAQVFTDRQTRDACRYSLAWNYGAQACGSVTGVTVTTANGNTCAAPIPVTLPGPVADAQGFETEQIGSDPLTVWVQLSGNPVTLNLVTPIAV